MPRQNVVHEVGLFQGKLGPRRAIIFFLSRDAENLQTSSVYLKSGSLRGAYLQHLKK
ncbi:TIR domain-containing protein [Halomonas sp.]|uniref:TIR domain-containing protein n=1 Tax=Halomonas sp. TaxID=1486246 RepID=UPI003A0FDB41